MKGIILSGGSGSRLYPITFSISKQIIPIYDKPMIYYPLSVLMLSGIKDIMIITNKEHIKVFKKQLGDGSSLGIKISYEIQKKPNGIPEAFLIAEKFINNQNVLLILGDNLFYGQQLGSLLKRSFSKNPGAKIFLHQVKNPNEYGVVELNKNKKIKKIVEKPRKFISNYAVTGMYLFDQRVISLTKKLKPSKRNELEITDLLNLYLKKNKLNYEILGRGHTWFDAGTHDSLLSASQFIKAIEDRQGFKIGCIEEISFANKWINKVKLNKFMLKYKNSPYGNYLKNIPTNNN
jgi:glucose-1-phosphate thymidylyltransferase